MDITGACHCGNITWKAVAQTRTWSPSATAPTASPSDHRRFSTPPESSAMTLNSPAGNSKRMESSRTAVMSATTVSVATVARGFIPATLMVWAFYP